MTKIKMQCAFWMCQSQISRHNSCNYSARSDHDLPNEKWREIKHKYQHKNRFDKCQNIRKGTLLRGIEAGSSNLADGTKGIEIKNIGRVFEISAFTSDDVPNRIPM